MHRTCFNPHLHVLITDGCFYGDGMFKVAPRFHTKTLEKIFRHKVFPAMRGTTFKGKNHERSDQHADVVAPFGLQCLLRAENPIRRRENYLCRRYYSNVSGVKLKIPFSAKHLGLRDSPAILLAVKKQGRRCCFQRLLGI